MTGNQICCWRTRDVQQLRGGGVRELQLLFDWLQIGIIKLAAATTLPDVQWRERSRVALQYVSPTKPKI